MKRSSFDFISRCFWASEDVCDEDFTALDLRGCSQLQELSVRAGAVQLPEALDLKELRLEAKLSNHFKTLQNTSFHTILDHFESI